MYDQIDKRRAKRIYAILVKFASGDLNARIHRSDVYDDVEVLISIINATLEKVSTFFYHQGFANLRETYSYNVQSFFLLDSDDGIITLSHNVKKLLGIDSNHLKEKPFYEILTDTSQLDWHRLKSKLLETPNEFIVLSFKTKQGSILKMNCLVDKFFGKSESSGGIIVTAVEIEKHSEKIKKELYTKVATSQNKIYIHKAASKKYQFTLLQGDIEKLEKVHFFILNKLDKPLPPLEKLAKMVGTNESRLKYGFKAFYGESVNKFFKKEQLKKRLNKAMQLVKYSNMPLEEIASLTGFNHFSNFSFAFKREFKQAPSDIRNHKANKRGKDA